MLTKEQKKITKSIHECFLKYDSNIDELLFQLNSILDEFDEPQKIKLLKKSECLIDKHDNKSKVFINKLLRIENIPNYLKQYLSEVVIINLIFNECNRLQKKINHINPNKRMSAMLVAMQLMLKTAKNGDNVLSYDRIVEFINSGFKNLIYDNEIYNGEEFIYGKKDYFSFGFFNNGLNDANQYVRNSIDTAIFEIEYNEWKNGYRSFTSKNNEIVSSITDRSIEFFYKTAVRDSIINHLFNVYFIVSTASKDNYLNDIGISFEFGKFLLERKYFCDCTKIQINGVTIHEWLKAYYALKKYVKTQNFKYCYERVSLFQQGIKNKISKSKDDWIEILVKYGVSKECACSLFESMIFNKKSIDLFDDPFVPCCGKYFIIPLLIDEMEPGQVLLSKLNDKKGIDFKGYSFENYIIDILKYLEIPAIRMEHKEKSTPYQCDVAFLLNDTLFLCECKNRSSNKSNDLSLDEMDDDIQQINRIANFYLKNPIIVKNCFHNYGYKNITYNRIQKVVVYSKVTHGTINKNDTLIMDLYKFLQPLSRDEMTDYLAKKHTQIRDSLTGKVTAKKVLNYYNQDVYFSNYSDMFSWKNISYKLGKYKIYSQKIDFGDWLKTIDYNFIYKYCISKKMKLYYVQKMYESGKILSDSVPPELRNNTPKK